jgi:hypothetical protein
MDIHVINLLFHHMKLIFIDFINWYKYKEPFLNKIKRWIFKEKNIVPPTVYEQRLGDV